MPFGVKVVYPGKPDKTRILGDHATHADALTHKINLMKRTEDEDTEYYVVPIDKNRKEK